MSPVPAPRPDRRIALASVLWAALLLGACTNPFKPADPEPPDSTGVPERWNSPEEVLETMALALATRSTNGATTYLRAYAESTQAGDRAYRAFYDLAVKTGWQSATQLTAPEPWDTQLERNVHAAISTIRPNYDYVWNWATDPDSPIDEDPTLQDTVLYHRRYTLVAAPGDGSADTIAIGFADLAFQKKDGRWSVFRWVDRVDPAVGVNPAKTDMRTMSWYRLESLTQ